MSIEVIFRLINFAVLLGLASYFFLKKALPTVRSALWSKQEKRKKIRDDVSIIQQEQQAVLHELEEQEQLCHKLRTKVDHWRAQTDQGAATWHQQQAALEASLEHKRHQQAQNFSVQATYEKIKEPVLDDTQRILENTYKDVSALQNYNEKIIRFLKNHDDK